METIEIQKCVSCSKSSLIDDLQRGERICSNCGIVVVEQMEDYGPERMGISSDTGMKLARATGQTTLAQHDLGISTEISMGSTDYITSFTCHVNYSRRNTYYRLSFDFNICPIKTSVDL